MFKAVLILIILFKLALGYVFLGELYLNLIVLLTLHLLGSICLYFFLQMTKVEKIWIYPILLIEFSIPLYGLVALIGGFFVQKLFFRFSSTLSESSSHFYLADYEQNLVNKNIRVGSPKGSEDVRNIRPYLDILNTNSVDLKIDICIKLSNSDESSSIELLKIALRDSDYEVRYMANNALGKIEKEFLVEIEKVSNLIEKFPTVIVNFIKRAETYLEMNQCGILDSSLKSFFLERARDDLQMVLMHQSFSPFIYIKLAYIYNELGDYRSLVLLTEKAILFEMDTNEKNKLIFFAVEGYFHLRNFKRVSELIYQIDLSQVKYKKISETVEFWRSFNEGF